jgi:hypothetical protein
MLHACFTCDFHGLRSLEIAHIIKTEDGIGVTVSQHDTRYFLHTVLWEQAKAAIPHSLSNINDNTFFGSTIVKKHDTNGNVVPAVLAVNLQRIMAHLAVTGV